MASDGASGGGSGSWQQRGDAQAPGVVEDAKSNALHAMATKVARHFPQVPVINCTQLKKFMDEPTRASGLCIVDVRQREEMEVSMIPGSISADEFERRKADFKGKTVVCYCTIGYRSSAYALKLQQQGFEAKNLEGSIVRWVQKGYPLVTCTGGGGGEQATKRIHVFGKQWALQPDDYEAVMFKNPVLSVGLSSVRRVLPAWLGGKK